MNGWVNMNERMNGTLRDQLHEEEVNKWVAPLGRGLSNGQ